MDRHRQPGVDAGRPERVVARVVIRGQLEVAGRQHHAREARFAQPVHVLHGCVDVVRLDDAHTRAAAGQLSAEVGEPPVEDAGAGLPLFPGGIREREGRAPGRFVAVLEVREEDFGDDALPLELAVANVGVVDALQSSAGDGFLPGVHVDHRLAEQGMHQLAVLGQAHGAVALTAPLLAGHDEPVELLEPRLFHVGPEVGDRRPGMAVGRDRGQDARSFAFPFSGAENGHVRS